MRSYLPTGDTWYGKTSVGLPLSAAGLARESHALHGEAMASDAALGTSKGFAVLNPWEIHGKPMGNHG